MLKQIFRMLLLVALLSALLASSIPSAAKACMCAVNGKPHIGGCHFDAKASQCINTGCPGWCY